MVMWSLLKRREKERPQRSSPGWKNRVRISGSRNVSQGGGALSGEWKGRKRRERERERREA